MVRKEYSRFIPSKSLFCHFCRTFYKNKDEMLIIYLKEDIKVKICHSCKSVIDSKNQMKTEALK